MKTPAQRDCNLMQAQHDRHILLWLWYWGTKQYTRMWHYHDRMKQVYCLTAIVKRIGSLFSAIKATLIMRIPLQNDYWNKPASSHHAAILGLSTVPVLCALCVTAPSRWIFSGVYHPGYLSHSIWNANNAQTHYTVCTFFMSNASVKRESFYSQQCLPSTVMLSIT